MILTKEYPLSNIQELLTDLKGQIIANKETGEFRTITGKASADQPTHRGPETSQIFFFTTDKGLISFTELSNFVSVPMLQVAA